MARLIHLVFALLVIGPILIWLGAAAGVLTLANGFGCTIHEGFATPCLIAGTDWGEAAYTLGLLAAWGPLIFAPVVIGSAALWGLFALVRAFLRRRAHRACPQPDPAIPRGQDAPGPPRQARADRDGTGA